MREEVLTPLQSPAGEGAESRSERAGARQPETEVRARFEELVEGLDAIVWEKEVSGPKFTYVSRRAEEILGYPVERWLSEPAFWPDILLHAEDRERAVDFSLTAAREARDHEFEYRVVAADGRVVWLRDLVRVVRDERGEPRLLRGVLIDITRQKEAEEALRDRERYAALAADVGGAVATGGELREILQHCAEAIVQHLDAAFARIWTLNEAEQLLELQASAGMYTHLNGPHGRVPMGAFKIGKIAAEKQPHLTNDVPHDPRVSDKEWARREGMVAFAGYPLLVEKRVVGVVAMFAREPLAESTLGALRGVAERLGLIVERERTGRELRRRERQLAEAQEIAHLGSWEWEVGSHTVLWSEEVHRIFGVPPGTPITYESYTELLHPEDRELVTSTVQRSVESGEGYQFEHRIVRPDGSVRHLYSHGEVERDHQGRPLRLFGVVQDVTERKEAAERAQQLTLAQVARAEAEAAQRQITRILESITDAFFALDGEWRFTYVNTEAENLLQRSARQLLGRNIWDEFPEAVGSTFHQKYRRAVEERRTVQFQEFYPPLDTWFEVRAFPSDEGLSVYFRDITAQREAEEAVRQSEERFRSLVEATAAIVWTTPASGRLEGEQPQWSAFTGQSREEYEGWGWLEMIHPDDRAHTAAAWEHALETRSLYEAEHRLCRRDGEYRTMLARALPILERDGTIREWVGIHMDITARKLMEERQRFLAEAGGILASSLDYETTLKSVAQLAVPTLADWCAIHLVDQEGDLHRVEVAHTDPARRELARDLERRYPPDPEAPAGVWHVLRTGEPELVPEIPEELLEQLARDAEHLRLIRELGLRSYMVVPLMVRGRTLGAITFVAAESGRRYGAHDLRTAEELALRAAFAVDNAQLFRELESALRQVATERGRLQELFMQAPAFITSLRGPHHVFEMANAHYLSLVGERELLGKPVAEALPEVVEQGFGPLLDRVYASGEPFVGNEVPVYLQQAGGALEQRFVNFVYQPIREANGAVSGIFVHGVDVTNQVLARKQVEEKAEELSRLARALERSNRELDQFAYVTSHDLKAPLRGIANLSQWIEEDLGEGVPEQTREHLHLLRGRVHRMEGLIDGILQYSRAGRVRDPVQEVEVGALLNEVLDMLAPPENVSIAVQERMPSLITERLPLHQVLMNLIGNAIKYNDRPDARVEVGVREADREFYEFFVADNGPGIAPEYHERIFGIFQTLHPRDRVEGTGIGLSLVRKIVETRGGKVWVESEEGAGATFRFLWPKNDSTQYSVPSSQ